MERDLKHLKVRLCFIFWFVSSCPPLPPFLCLLGFISVGSVFWDILQDRRVRWKEGKCKWCWNKIFPACLTESCLFRCDLKDLFPLHKLNFKVVFDC